MKKHYVLFILGFFLAGCSSTSSVKPLPLNYVQGKNGLSVVVGKVKFIGVPGDFKEAWLGWENQEDFKQYPISLGLPVDQSTDSKGKLSVEYYFFIELPAGHYSVPTVVAQHSRFQNLDTHLLNANLTIKENTVVYVGTIQIDAIGRSLEHIGPMTEAQIVDEFPQVVEYFKKKYPQFQDVTVEKDIIDRYRWFKGDHIETDFDKN